MAFGNSDNNNKRYYDPTVYSQYGTSNSEGVDPSALSFQFYNGMLKLSITPMKPNANPNDKNIWDKDNAVAVWITWFKAKMLYDEIKYVLENPDTCFNAAVSIGAESLISFSTGKELGVSSPCLIIRKVNHETGEVMSTYAYQFKDNYNGYSSVRNYDPSNPNGFESHNYKNLEVENLLTLLKQYYESSSGAYAYANLYAARYDIQKNNTKMELIMEKLGIEKPEYSRGTSQNTGNRGSFFMNTPTNAGSNPSNSIPGNSGMRSTTMEELESEMD